MKLSVVVCAKNEARYLPRCIAALRAQLLKPEIVVVYASSEDSTEALAKALADVAIKDNNRGLAAARNLGWKYATGNIIAYCDADSVPPPDWTATIAQRFAAEPELLALSGPLILTPKARLKLRVAFKIWAELFPAFCAALGYHNIWGANMAFRRTILRKFPFATRFLEDYELGRRLRHYIRHSGHGKLKFDRALKMPVSSRRFERSFHRLAIKYYVLNWLRIKFGKPIKYSYF